MTLLYTSARWDAKKPTFCFFFTSACHNTHILTVCAQSSMFQNYEAALRVLHQSEVLEWWVMSLTDDCLESYPKNIPKKCKVDCALDTNRSTSLWNWFTSKFFSKWDAFAEILLFKHLLRLQELLELSSFADGKLH